MAGPEVHHGGYGRYRNAEYRLHRGFHPAAAEIAIKEADVILFVCDARTGITIDDEEVAKMLRQSRKPVVLAVNKADTPKQENDAYEFYNLGIGEPYMISASNRLNLGDLLDAVVEKFPLPRMMTTITTM